MQVLEPDNEYFPGEQDEQKIATPPMRLVFFPASQSSQEVAFEFGVYLPVGHEEHVIVPSDDPNVPGVQSVHEGAPAALYVPISQETQSAAASWFDANVAASELNVPGTQFPQALEAVCATDVLYVPAAQIVQSERASWAEAVVAASAR